LLFFVEFKLLLCQQLNEKPQQCCMAMQIMHYNKKSEIDVTCIWF